MVRLVTILAIIIPLAAVIAAPFFTWQWGFHWTDSGLLKSANRNVRSHGPGHHAIAHQKQAQQAAGNVA